MLSCYLEQENKRKNDLINRQAATNDFYKYPNMKWTTLDILEHINTLPSVQPEIIWCKDCKYWDTTWQNDFAPNYHYCPMIDGTRRDDFYCADAERRTDE